MSRRRPLRGLKHRRAAAVPAAPGSPTCSAPAPARPQPPTPGLRMPALHRCPDLLSPSGAPLGAEDSRVQAASPGRVGPACDMRHVHGLVSVSLHGRASLSCLPPSTWSPGAWWPGTSPELHVGPGRGLRLSPPLCSRLSHVASGWTWWASSPAPARGCSSQGPVSQAPSLGAGGVGSTWRHPLTINQYVVVSHGHAGTAWPWPGRWPPARPSSKKGAQSRSRPLDMGSLSRHLGHLRVSGCVAWGEQGWPRGPVFLLGLPKQPGPRGPWEKADPALCWQVTGHCRGEQASTSACARHAGPSPGC